MQQLLVKKLLISFRSLAEVLRAVHAHAGHDRHPAAAFRHGVSAQPSLAQPPAVGQEAAASWSLAVTTRKDSPVRNKAPAV